MREYKAPTMKETLLRATDVIAVSNPVNSIVSQGDSENADEIRESLWNDAWN